MKRLLFVLAVCFAMALSGCEAEKPLPSMPETASPTQTTVPPEATTVPPETTVPVTTEPPETTIPETLPLSWIPPQQLVSAKTQLPLVRFATYFYSQEGQEGELYTSLPEEYVYIGYTISADPEYCDYPMWPGLCFNLSENLLLYASLSDPEYLFYDSGNGYQRLVRSGLEEYTMEQTGEDLFGFEHYTDIFFESLLTHSVGQNSYHQACYITFRDPADLDLGELFYNGFPEDSWIDKPFTDREMKFLEQVKLADMYKNVTRISGSRMHQTLSRYFGISLSETKGVGVEKLGYYFDQTDCYYVWRSDMRGFNVESVTATYDSQTGTYQILVTQAHRESWLLTLKQEGNILRILSGIPAES